MSTENNKPAATLRDGALKVTIWRNFGEKGTFYSVEPSRTYEDKQGKLQDAHNLSGTDPIQMARLLHLAYTRIAELRQQDAQDLKQQPAA